MKNILIFGGSGFIGAEICNVLCSVGHVICADNYSRNEQKDSINSSVEHVECDVTDSTSVIGLCKRADVVINLAFINGTTNFYSRPRDVFKVALEGQLNVINGISRSNVERFIYASSSEVYQTPPNVPTSEDIPLMIPDINNPRYSYGGGKIIGEMMCKYYLPKEVSYQVFRPHNIYGPNMGFEHVITELIKKIYNANLVNGTQDVYKIELQGSGKSTRSFCYIKDFGDGFKCLWDNAANNEVYNIGTNQEVSISYLVEILSKIMGRNLTFDDIPLPPGSTTRRCPDISKLEKLGYTPKFTLHEGLEVMHQWFLKKYG